MAGWCGGQPVETMCQVDSNGRRSRRLNGSRRCKILEKFWLCYVSLVVMLSVSTQKSQQYEAEFRLSNGHCTDSHLL